MIYKSKKELIIIKTQTIYKEININKVLKYLQKPNYYIYFENNNQIYGAINIKDIFENYNTNNKIEIKINNKFQQINENNYMHAKKLFKENDLLIELPIIINKKLKGSFIKGINFECIKQIYKYDIIFDKFLINKFKQSNIFFIKSSNNYKTNDILFLSNFFRNKNLNFNFISCKDLLLRKKTFNYNDILLVESDAEEKNYEIITKILNNPIYYICSLNTFYDNYINEIKSMISYKYLSYYFSELQKQNVNIYNIIFSQDETIKEYDKKITEEYAKFNLLKSNKILNPKEFFSELYTKKYCNDIVNNDVTIKNISGINYMQNCTSKYFNINNGIRKTANNIKNPQHKIHMFGPCICFGSFVEDKYTISSYIQKHLNNDKIKSNVINHGNWNNTISQLELINNTDLYSGDTIIYFDLYNIIDGIKNIDLKNVINKYNPPIEWLVDSIFHVNHKVNKLYADEIYNNIKYNLDNNYNKIKVKKQNNIFINAYIERYFNIINLQKYEKTGAIVMNCNPFTLGHRYLIEQAKKYVDFLIIFVVSEDESIFSFKERYSMVINNLKDLKDIYIVPSENIILSKKTFPEYFIKTIDDSIEKNIKNDIEIFSKHIAPRLNIKYRFVGNEPIDKVTETYNNLLKKELPKYGIKLVEIQRKKINNDFISASKVRKLIKENNLELLEKYIPKATKDMIFTKKESKYNMNTIKIFGNNSILINQIYIDPYKIDKNYEDALYIFITHNHYCHYSIKDIKKILTKKTKIIIPNTMYNQVKKDFPNNKILKVLPDSDYKIDNIHFKTTYAYNMDKPYHKKEDKFVGYSININNVNYFITGDTDNISEIQNIKCDYLFIPIGGITSMDYIEAAKLTNKIHPTKVIPTSYKNSEINDFIKRDFMKKIDKEIECEFLFDQKSIIIIIPYFGKFNNYFNLFLESIRYNDSIDFLIITDDKRKFNYPKNVKVIYSTFKKEAKRFCEYFDNKTCCETPYKLVEYKPFYGEIYKEFTHDYDFWGWCDTDVILGNLNLFLKRYLISKDNTFFFNSCFGIFRNNYKYIDRLNYKYNNLKYILEKVNDKNVVDINLYQYKFNNLNLNDFSTNRDFILQYKEGHLFLLNDNSEVTEVMMVRFNNRNLNNFVNKVDSFYIVPNRFIDENSIFIHNVFNQLTFYDENVINSPSICYDNPDFKIDNDCSLDIIIPAYNCKKTVKRALFSIALQSYLDNVSVYLVNDCSDYDYSEEISLFNNFYNIKEIKLDKNCGSGLARQKGIDNSNGKYIMFMDADDYFYNAFSIFNLVKYVKDYNADIGISNFIEIDDDGTFSKKNVEDTTWLHGKIFLRKFIEKNNIYFNESRYNEDVRFNKFCLIHSPKIVYIYKTTYVYNMYKESITRIKDGVFYTEGYIQFINNLNSVISIAMEKKINKEIILSNCLDFLIGIYGIYISNGYPDLYLSLSKELFKVYADLKDEFLSQEMWNKKLDSIYEFENKYENLEISFDRFLNLIEVS